MAGARRFRREVGSMRAIGTNALSAAILAAALGGCAYYPVPPDPIRIVDSTAELAACRSLGTVGPPVRTDGREPFLYGSITTPVPANSPMPYFGYGEPPESEHFGIRLQAMRDVALARGATDLLLRRRPYRDWSYVQGVAYRCPR